MGMDVYGVNPKCERGEYFRRSVWGWRPLWQYCEDRFPGIAGKVQYPFTNDGDGLDDQDAVALASYMIVDIEAGDAADYVAARNLIIDATPNEVCTYCHGTGVRQDQVGLDMLMPDQELHPDVAERLGRSHGWCNGCGGEGTTSPWDSHYSLDVDDIRDFAVFAARSGGFRIC
jgi:hypothetical protein